MYKQDDFVTSQLDNTDMPICTLKGSLVAIIVSPDHSGLERERSLLKAISIKVISDKRKSTFMLNVHQFLFFINIIKCCSKVL